MIVDDQHDIETTARGRARERELDRDGGRTRATATTVLDRDARTGQGTHAKRRLGLHGPTSYPSPHQAQISGEGRVKAAPDPIDGEGVSLRLLASPVEPETAAPRDPIADVRATRRSIARFLRALHASGHGTTAWPSGLVSRLAHADAVTARFLAEPNRVDPENAIEAADQLRAIESWVTAKLTPRERARLRTFELAIRIETSELEQPLVQPDRAPEDDAPALAGTGSNSLRGGLGRLDAEELDDVGRRLGLRAPSGRVDLERDITRLLRDEALLRILVATLPRDALELLAALVRGIGDRATLVRLDEAPIARAVGESARAPSPIAHLRSCALVFASAANDNGQRFWVPVELRHRIDGLLRAIGV